MDFIEEDYSRITFEAGLHDILPVFPDDPEFR